MFVVVSTLASLYGIMFGTIDSKIIPISREKTYRKDVHEYIYLLQPSKLIVCNDDDDRIHYFVHERGYLKRCLWTHATTQHEKTVLFIGMRDWYERITQCELNSSLQEVDDMEAWTSSSGLDDL